jgi:hypothetical protein
MIYCAGDTNWNASTQVCHLRLLGQLPLHRVRSHFLQLLPRRLELLGQLLLRRVVLQLHFSRLRAPPLVLQVEFHGVELLA